MNREIKFRGKRIDNGKCVLYPGIDVNKEGEGCYVGIDRNNKQKLVGGVLSERK